MRWAEVLNDPCLKDLPYKIELNEYGQIVMSPASNKHALLQSKIDRFLGIQFSDGEPMTECSIETAKGVKVADVVWCSDHFLSQYNLTTPYPAAPELCIEIMSPSNSTQEMTEKRQLYFERGAREVWIVTEDGEIIIYNSDGPLQQSSFGDFGLPDLSLWTHPSQS